MSGVVIHSRTRRLPKAWVMLAAAAAGAGAGALWSLSSPASDAAAPVGRTPPAVVPAVERDDPAPRPPMLQAAAAAAPPLAAPPPPAPSRSSMVAPGVHITPMSVPAGTVPVPAGPRAHDSEPEEN